MFYILDENNISLLAIKYLERLLLYDHNTITLTCNFFMYMINFKFFNKIVLSRFLLKVQIIKTGQK